MSSPAVEVDHVSKQFSLSGPTVSYRLLRDEIAQKFSNLLHPRSVQTGAAPSKTFWALKDIHFSVQPGEAVGIIGPNGAGKSTLLKILSRITYPTTGQVIMRGRAASLLEVGTGFSPELTGRENIYLNGSLLGMARREINNKIEQIMEFAEIGDFIDMPVKRYSSGMYVRLAFSIAAHLEPEILIIDEVLAVGDAKFQRKSLGKMDEVAKKSGRTVLFVSHDLGAVKRLCSKSVLIEKGKMIAFGKTSEIIEKYLVKVNNSVPKANETIPITNRSGSGIVRIENVHIENGKGKEVNFAVSGETLRFVFQYQAVKDIDKVNLSFSIHSQLGQNIILDQSKYTRNLFKVQKGKGKIICTIPSLPLISGYYLINVRVDIHGEESDFPRDPVCKLTVVDGDFYGTGSIPLQHSPVLVKSSWEIAEI